MEMTLYTKNKSQHKYFLCVSFLQQLHKSLFLCNLNTDLTERTVKMLFPHQEVAKQFLITKQRAILADSPRVGKTMPTAAAALENLPALIVCPAIVKTVWRDAIHKINPDIDVQIIKGRKGAEELDASSPVTIINYDLLGDIKKIAKFKTLVLDESHRIKNHKAKRTEACLKLMNSIPNVYALSGTPIPNRPIELFPLLKGLGLYRGGWYDFAVRYAKAWNAPWGLDTNGASNLPELKQLMSGHILRRTKDEVFKDYQEPAVSLITFDLPVDRREQAFAPDVLIDHPSPMLAFDGLAEVMVEAGQRKVKPAAEFIADKLTNGPVVVFAHHKSVVHQLEMLLAHEKPAIITGEVPSNKRDELIKDFQSGKTNLFIGNIAACSEGVDLSRADQVVFVEATWQTSALEQASSRVENINKNNNAVIYLLTIANSLDHTILKKILKKKQIINQII